MTVPERLSADLVSIQPSLRRAPTRNAEVRPNSDHYCHDAPSKAQNKIRIFAVQSESALLEPSLPDLASPSGHLPPIEIP
jgi:hypothetical protein